MRSFNLNINKTLKQQSIYMYKKTFDNMINNDTNDMINNKTSLYFIIGNINTYIYKNNNYTFMTNKSGVENNNIYNISSDDEGNKIGLFLNNNILPNIDIFNSYIIYKLITKNDLKIIYSIIFKYIDHEELYEDEQLLFSSSDTIASINIYNILLKKNNDFYIALNKLNDLVSIYVEYIVTLNNDLYIAYKSEYYQNSNTKSKNIELISKTNTTENINDINDIDDIKYLNNTDDSIMFNVSFYNILKSSISFDFMISKDETYIDKIYDNNIDIIKFDKEKKGYFNFFQSYGNKQNKLRKNCLFNSSLDVESEIFGKKFYYKKPILFSMDRIQKDNKNNNNFNNNKNNKNIDIYIEYKSDNNDPVIKKKIELVVIIESIDNKLLINLNDIIYKYIAKNTQYLYMEVYTQKIKTQNNKKKLCADKNCYTNTAINNNANIITNDNEKKNIIIILEQFKINEDNLITLNIDKNNYYMKKIYINNYYIVIDINKIKYTKDNFIESYTAGICYIENNYIKIHKNIRYTTPYDIKYLLITNLNNYMCYKFLAIYNNNNINNDIFDIDNINFGIFYYIHLDDCYMVDDKLNILLNKSNIFTYYFNFYYMILFNQTKNIILQSSETKDIFCYNSNMSKSNILKLIESKDIVENSIFHNMIIQDIDNERINNEKNYENRDIGFYLSYYHKDFTDDDITRYININNNIQQQTNITNNK